MGTGLLWGRVSIWKVWAGIKFSLAAYFRKPEKFRLWSDPHHVPPWEWRGK